MLRTFALTIVAGAILCTPCLAGSSTQWQNTLIPGELPQGEFTFGAWPGLQDGYDGYPPTGGLTQPGVYVLASRSNGPAWAGPTGLYSSDLESPIAAGGSHTWWEICLWSYNYTPYLGNEVGVGCTYGSDMPPLGYTGVLTIDYVPESLNWTGPMQFVIDLNKTTGFYLPCPVTDDPFNPDNVTRMHLTVYTYPVPEPNSLAALGLALAGLGAVRLRGRR